MHAFQPPLHRLVPSPLKAVGRSRRYFIEFFKINAEKVRMSVKFRYPSQSLFHTFTS